MAGQPDEFIAFIDESKRPMRNRRTGKVDITQWHYVLAVVIIMRIDLESVRQKILRIEADLNYELHYQEMKSNTRRCNAIEAIEQIKEWNGILFETMKPIGQSNAEEHRTRASQLKQSFQMLANNYQSTKVILETRAKRKTSRPTLDNKDIAVLQKLYATKKVARTFQIRHETKQEPILKIADLLASSRTDMLCVSDETIYPQIGHRVIIVKPK